MDPRRSGHSVTAIAFVHIGIRNGHSGDTLNRSQGLCQGVPVVGIARQQSRRHRPVPAIGRSDGDLLAEFIAFVGLALADALHLRLVQAVELVRILRLLLSNAIDARQQRSQRRIGFARLASNVSNQSSHVGAQLSKRSLHSLVLSGVGVAADLDLRDPGHTKIRLTQLDSAAWTNLQIPLYSSLESVG